MIVKGGAIGGGGLAAHLQKTDNERVEFLAVEGLLSTNITGAVAELRARAAGVTKKGIFHFQISPGLGEAWGADQEKAAIAALLKEYRLDGHSLIVVRHAKDAQGLGRDDHLHVVATRIKANGRVVDDNFSRVRNEKIARLLEYHLGHQLVPGRHNTAVMTQLRKDGLAEVAKWMQSAGIAERPKAEKTFAEHQIEARTGIKKTDVAAAVLAAFHAADSAKAFAAAIAVQGFKLAMGTKRANAILVMDTAGVAHELTRTLAAGLKASGIKASTAGVRAMVEAKAPDLAQIIAGQDIKAVRLDAKERTTIAATPDQKPALAELVAGGQFSPDSKAAVLKALNGWTFAARKRGQDTKPIKNMVVSVKAASRVSDLDPATRKWLTGWLARQTGTTPAERSKNGSTDRKRALRQSDTLPPPAREMAKRADRLSDLPGPRRLARHKDRNSLLLQDHASDLLRQQGTRNFDRLRRLGHRITEGEQTMAGIVGKKAENKQRASEYSDADYFRDLRVYNMDDETRAEMAPHWQPSEQFTDRLDEERQAESEASALFPIFYAEYRKLSAIRDRDEDQELSRAALADAALSTARSERNLRRLTTPEDARDIMSLVAERNKQHEAELRAEAASMQKPSSKEPKVFRPALNAFAEMPQGARKDAMGDALLTMAQNDNRLRRMAPDRADEILQSSKRHEATWAARLNMQPAKPDAAKMRLTIPESAKAWREVAKANPHLIKNVVETSRHVNIQLADGTAIRDTGNRLTSDEITAKTAEAMGLAAKAKGWTEVRLTGNEREKQLMAAAMTARGIAVSNPEMKDYIAGLDSAHKLAAEREALDVARQQPDLADVKLYEAAERAYQMAIVNNAPDGQLLSLKADLLARAEAVHDNGHSESEAWAREAEHVDAEQATDAYVATA